MILYLNTYLFVVHTIHEYILLIILVQYFSTYRNELVPLCGTYINKVIKMNKEEIRDYLLSRDLKASDVMRRSGGLIGLNQASGWVRKLRKGEDLSNPVLVMLWKIALEKAAAYSSDVVVKEKVVAQSDIDVPLKEEVEDVVIPKKEKEKVMGGKYVGDIEVRLIKKDSERVSWWIGSDISLYKSNEGRFTLQEVDNYKGINLGVLFKKYFG